MGLACLVKFTVAGAPRRFAVGKFRVGCEDVLFLPSIELGLVGGCKPVVRIVREGEIAAKGRFELVLRLRYISQGLSPKLKVTSCGMFYGEYVTDVNFVVGQHVLSYCMAVGAENV